jgi:hypothetical protein
MTDKKSKAKTNKPVLDEGASYATTGKVKVVDLTDESGKGYKLVESIDLHADAMARNHAKGEDKRAR